MRLHLSQPDRRHRQGFTLVELLVVMSIMAILATLTVSSFNSMADRDRVGNGASMLRGAIEGARSRALKTQRPVGLRLFLDPQDSRTITSVGYIASPEVVEGYCRVEFDNRTAPPAPTESAQKWRVYHVYQTNGQLFEVPENSDLDTESWLRFSENGLLTPGCIIEIEGENGQWNRYTLNEKLTDGTVDGPDSIWSFLPDYRDVSEDAILPGDYPDGGYSTSQRPANADSKESDMAEAPFGLNSAVASTPMKFRLHLAPVLLAGTSATPLPQNVCIDLDGSKVPDSWRPNGTQGYGRKFGGEIMPMDIIFTPSGTLDRSLLGEGFLHFRIADRRDVSAAREINGILPQGSSGATTSDGKYPCFVGDPQYDCRLVTIVTQTGIMRISNPDLDLSTVPEDGQFNNYLLPVAARNIIFRNAVAGREAKR